MRYVCANTGERLKVPSPASDGLATDHFSAAATRDYVQHVIARLESRLGDLRKTSLRQLYLASYEVRGAVWTPAFPTRFEEYRGYDLVPFLPALHGYVLDDDDTTERFLYDYRQTLGGLLVDAYYRTAVETAARAGLGVEAEAGGPGPPVHQVPVDALEALGAISEIRGEFWPWRMENPHMWVVKETACAAHIYGRKRVHMEAFTGFRHWQDGPSDLKPSADRAFCEGMNHVVWHTASHQPPEAGLPGWVYGAGTHLMPSVIWWPMAEPFLDYLARCSFLLQQGLFVADVCYYYGDQGFNFVPPKHVDPSLGFGYDYDVLNAEVLSQRLRVEQGRLVLPDGMSYELLVLPQTAEVNPAVLERIASLVRNGATVVGPRPTRATGLADPIQRDQQVRELAGQLWGPCDGVTVQEHRFGRGRVIWGKTLREVLQERGAGPDFVFTGEATEEQLDFIHRRTTEADIYFVRNKGRGVVAGKGRFRMRGRAPELWFPDSGRTEAVWTYEVTKEGIQLPLRLGPMESVFVVFRKPAGSQRLVTNLAGLSVRRVSEKTVDVTAHTNGTFELKTADGKTARCEFRNVPPPIQLAGPWKVSFPPGFGAPSAETWTELKSWTQHDDPAIRHFSGVARYAGEFELPASVVSKDTEIHLDLGELWSVGEIFLNGESAGVAWKSPFRVDVSALAQRGQNRLEIAIANTWANRLIGDSKLPKDQRVTRTNITGSGTPRKRWEDIELRPSGLFGPVTVHFAVRKMVPISN